MSIRFQRLMLALGALVCAAWQQPVAAQVRPIPAPVTIPPKAPTKVTPTQVVTTAGPPPQNVHVVAAGPAIHTVMWDRLSGVSGYLVDRKTPTTNGQWQRATPQLILAETFVDSNLVKPGSSYQITAIYPAGRQGATVFVYANPPQPQVPTGFTAQQIGPGQVRLTWQPVTFAAGYRLFGFGQPATGTFLPATQTTFSDLADGNYSWTITADYRIGYVGANLPAASIVLKTVTTKYRVVANGFRVVHATYDDMLQRDGKGDEVFGAFMMFHINRASSQVLDRDLRHTLVHGDVNGQSGRVQAGTASSMGGLVTGDFFPAVTDPSQRYGAQPTDTQFPFLVWQGTLTDQQDAVIIFPTLWEWDGNSQGYDQWYSNEMTQAPNILTDPVVRQSLSSPTIQLIAPAGSTGVAGGPAISVGQVVAMANLDLQAVLLAGSFDRPIGVMGLSTAPKLPRRAIVLTREKIETTLGLKPSASSGIMAVALVDAPWIPDLQGSYVLYLQVERIP